MASGDIQVLSRRIAVAPSLTRRDATYVGDLDDGYSMIDLNGHLPARDRGDFYRFRVTQRGGLRIDLTASLPGSTPDNPKPAPDRAVRLQLLNLAGRVIADSDPTSGDAYAAYQKLTSDQNLELARGTYLVKRSRGEQGDSNQAYDFSLTMQAAQVPITVIGGGYTGRVFDNIEQPAPAQRPMLSATSPVSGVLGLFSTDVTTGLFIDTLA
jgi:hypothetical protein